MDAGLSCTPGAIDLHTVIGEAIEELRLAYPGRELRHVRVGDGGCTGDASRLVQLVGNLVSNALTYGRADTTLTVTTRCEERLELVVHNEGAAIPESLRVALFEPMTRGATGSAARRVGLGLFIVREIARAHGGAVAVEPTDTGGTTFTVTMPR